MRILKLICKPIVKLVGWLHSLPRRVGFITLCCLLLLLFFVVNTLTIDWFRAYAEGGGGLAHQNELNNFQWLEKHDGFMQRRHCGADWNDRLVMLNQVGQLSIFLWYSIIPITLFWLMHLVLYRLQIPRWWPLGVVLMGLFVWTCGYTHYVGFRMFDTPVYYKDTYYLWVCSVTSAAYVIWVIVGSLFPVDIQALVAERISRRNERHLKEMRERQKL